MESDLAGDSITVRNCADMLSGNRSSPELEALLYDWHNGRRLIAQQHDVSFWLERLRSSSSVLVLGAGTGRVAAPLAQAMEGTVVALDLNKDRLRRISPTPGIVRICGDMRSLPFKGFFDTILVPYSAFQLLSSPDEREQTVRGAASVLAPGGSLYIDVSTSFDSRPSSTWQRVMQEPCEELGVEIAEFESSRREGNGLRIDREFRTTNGNVVCATSESWTYFHHLKIRQLLLGAGLDLVEVQSGYGANKSSHRRIYWARRSDSVASASCRVTV